MCIRDSIGPLNLGELQPGEWRHLTEAEVRALQHSAAAPAIRDAEPSRRPARKEHRAPRTSA